MLEGGARLSRIVEPERDGVGGARGQVAHHRVVGVHDDGGACPESRNGRPPAPGHELELAVAVELVAEEVRQADDTRADAARHLRERALVHLEEAEVGDPRRQQRRRHPTHQIRAGAVVRHAQPGAEDLGGHGGGRRLAVRRRHERRPQRQPRGEPVDRVRVELRQELARNRGAAAPPGGAGKAGRCTRRRHLDRQWKRDPHRPSLDD
jgi:hypothetical protein